MKILAAALGGILLVVDYSYSAPVAVALLLYVFWDQLSNLAGSAYASLAGAWLLRDLRRNPHRRASGLLVLCTTEALRKAEIGK
jgi:uncharacterized membrane protein YfcA